MKKHKKFICIVTFIILIILFYLLLPKKNYKHLYDDVLFVNFFQKEKNEKNKDENKQYIFKIDWKNTDFKNINLLDTIDRKTLVDEKIAPGVEGNFQIILEANENTNYYITFQSINYKPKNLKFENVETNTQVEEIEDLNSELKGKIRKNEKKTINIHWSWQYENTGEDDWQDTLDSKIDKYEFIIYANGQKEINTGGGI